MTSLYARQFDQLGERRPSVLDCEQAIIPLVGGAFQTPFCDSAIERRFERHAYESMAFDWIVETVRPRLGGDPAPYRGWPETATVREAFKIYSHLDIRSHETWEVIAQHVEKSARQWRREKSRSGRASGTGRQEVPSAPLLPAANSFGGAHART